MVAPSQATWPPLQGLPLLLTSLKALISFWDDLGEHDPLVAVSYIKYPLGPGNQRTVPAGSERLMHRWPESLG